jgi:hypothetical protein
LIIDYWLLIWDSFSRIFFTSFLNAHHKMWLKKFNQTIARFHECWESKIFFVKYHILYPQTIWKKEKETNIKRNSNPCFSLWINAIMRSEFVQLLSYSNFFIYRLNTYYSIQKYPFERKRGYVPIRIR